MLGPEERACAEWGTGNGLVFIGHRFSVRRVMSAMRKARFWAEDFDNQVEEYQFDILGNRKHLGYCVHEWHVYREAFLAGLWAAWIVNLWTRLFRTQIRCCRYAFYSRWFVDKQVMTSTFNLVEVRDMDLTNKRRWQRAGKNAEGGWGLQGRDFTVIQCSPWARTWAKAQFLNSRSCRQLGETGEESNMMEEVRSSKCKINPWTQTDTKAMWPVK